MMKFHISVFYFFYFLYIVQTYPLGLYSLQLHHYLLLESLTLCAFFVAQDGKLPDYDNDPSYNMYLPLSTHVSSLSLIVFLSISLSLINS